MAAASAPLGQLVELVGLAASLRLVDRFGGTTVYVPREQRVHDHNPIALAIGTEATRKLAAAWPGEYVSIPLGAAYLRRQRDRAILEDLKRLSVSAVAMKYETTERHVYRIQQREPDLIQDASDDAQGDLFGA